MNMTSFFIASPIYLYVREVTYRKQYKNDHDDGHFAMVDAGNQLFVKYPGFSTTHFRATLPWQAQRPAVSSWHNKGHG